MGDSKPTQRGRRPAVRRWARLFLAVALALWAATVDAAWRSSGIVDGRPGCLDFVDQLKEAQDGDTLAPLIAGGEVFAGGPDFVIAKNITIEGGWNYASGHGTDFPCITAVPPDSSSQYFERLAQRSAIIAGFEAPALTISSSVGALTLDQILLARPVDPPGPAAFRGGLLFGDNIGNSAAGKAQIGLHNVEINGGQSNEEGGGAYLVLRNGSTLTIADSLITGNTSGVDPNQHPRPGSGGLYIDVREGSRLVITNTIISENTAAGSAGGFKITVRDGSSVVISNSQMLNNTAQGQSDGAKDGGGGRILIYDGSVELTGNSFSGNQAPNGCGGGLSIEKVGSGGTANVVLDGNTFTNNTAADHPNLCLKGIDLLQSVALNGPSTVQLGQANTFTASISPATAALPIAYVWEATDQPRLELTGGASDQVPYTWTTPGTKTVTVTASFTAPDGYNRQATITKTITITVPPQSVTIQGPASGVSGTPYTFSAVVSPGETTAPISYAWSPQPDQGQGTASATYTWSMPGSKSVSVTAQNAAGSASDSHTVQIEASAGEPPKFKIFLPVIRRE